MKASVRGRPEWEMRAGQSDDVGREGNRGEFERGAGQGPGQGGQAWAAWAGVGKRDVSPKSIQLIAGC